MERGGKETCFRGRGLFVDYIVDEVVDFLGFYPFTGFFFFWESFIFPIYLRYNLLYILQWKCNKFECVLIFLVDCWGLGFRVVDYFIFFFNIFQRRGICLTFFELSLLIIP